MLLLVKTVISGTLLHMSRGQVTAIAVHNGYQQVIEKTQVMFANSQLIFF